MRKPENLKLLKELIDKSGYKPYILSLKMGHDKSTVYAWLKGRHEPSAKDMIELARILQVSVETIVRIFGEVE